jgi:hypothetical protein
MMQHTRRVSREVMKILIVAAPFFAIASPLFSSEAVERVVERFVQTWKIHT